jgi:hypothetical protein
MRSGKPTKPLRWTSIGSAAMAGEAKQRQRDEVYRPTPEEIARDLIEIEIHA